MKLLLLGAGGQVGFELQRVLAPLGELVCATRGGTLPGGAECEIADLSRPESLVGLLDAESPDVVVNAAAYTAVDRAEGEAALAHAINAEGPRELARWCARHGRRLLHYSTDYVFDGQGARPYREDDATAPLGEYGRGKLAGEDAIRASGAEHLILRTAWVYAARGHNFLRTMLRLGRERDVLRVVADQRGAPTPARWIAAATAALLVRGASRHGFDRLTPNGNRESGLGDPFPQSVRGELVEPHSATSHALRGTFHLTAAGETTWHGFAQAIFEDAAAAGLLPRAPRLEAIATADYPTPARRPAYSRLDNGRLYDASGLRLPDWRRGVSEVIAEFL
jgi:dTDP-4-dehydrorhamnose reductase